MLLDACTRHARLPAFECLGTTMTYADWERVSRAFAAFLVQEAKFHPGDRIAIMLPNLLAYPVAFLGAARAGLTVVNVNPLYTPRELKEQLIHFGATAIVIMENFAHKLEPVLGDTQICHVVVARLGDFMPPIKRAVFRLDRALLDGPRDIAAHRLTARALAHGGATDQAAGELRVALEECDDPELGPIADDLLALYARPEDAARLSRAVPPRPAATRIVMARLAAGQRFEQLEDLGGARLEADQDDVATLRMVVSAGVALRSGHRSPHAPPMGRGPSDWSRSAGGARCASAAGDGHAGRAGRATGGSRPLARGGAAGEAGR